MIYDWAKITLPENIRWVPIVAVIIFIACLGYGLGLAEGYYTCLHYEEIEMQKRERRKKRYKEARQ